MYDIYSEEDIEHFEEMWQKVCYRESPESSDNTKSYVKCCELCNKTEDINRIEGGHYICSNCKHELMLIDPRTISKEASGDYILQKRYEKAPDEEEDFQPNMFLQKRKEAWKEIIRCDYALEIILQALDEND